MGRPRAGRPHFTKWGHATVAGMRGQVVVGRIGVHVRACVTPCHLAGDDEDGNHRAGGPIGTLAGFVLIATAVNRVMR